MIQQIKNKNLKKKCRNKKIYYQKKKNRKQNKKGLNSYLLIKMEKRFQFNNIGSKKEETTLTQEKTFEIN